MKRIEFNSSGKFVGVDGADAEDSEDDFDFCDECKVQVNREVTEIFDESYWSLYSNDKMLNPLKFSNGKSQADVVKEVVDLVKAGNKVVFIHGTCGTGKSAIALNIARELGRASIVVPIKSLQRQYEEDYKGKKYVLKKNGKRMKIEMITGRSNHDSVIQPGVSCADPFLPDTIQLIDKNSEKLKEFYDENPYINDKSMADVRDLKRIAIAPANPHWSPIVPASYELKQMKDARKKRYKGLRDREFIFYHRKEGCSYYDQYQAYIDADVIIFNSAKYKIETALDRKPATEVEIIDESDEFLDSFSNQQELNLTRFRRALKNVFPEERAEQEVIDEITRMVDLEEKNKRILGIDESQIFLVGDTKLEKALKLFLKNPALCSEISVDDGSYANRGIEIARDYAGFFEDTYVTFRKHEEQIFVNFTTTNVSKKLKEMLDKNKVVVFMSGTLHSKDVLEHVFGIKNYKVVEAEEVLQGVVEIHRTGKEIDCKYSNFKSGRYSKKDYFIALSACLEKAKKPFLVHVNAFDDLPLNKEIGEMGLKNLISKEKLFELQGGDRTGKLISMFKRGMNDSLFSTKCTRGIDFPGKVCNSVIFTKYPNPNVRGTFWKVLQKTHSQWYWEFYKDKARRDFLQRLYRAVRSKDDHVFVLSPDSRVLDAVRDLQVLQNA